MISISHLSFYFGARPIYKDANLHIRPKDRIGLIGANGTGKTTLLKIITGEYKPEEGTISMSNDCTIGFLNQDLLSYESDEPILHIAMQGLGEVLLLQAQIEKLLLQMEQQYDENLVTQLAALQEQFEHLGGYKAQSTAEEVLEGLGFSTSDLMRPLREFSGGWRMRVMLAKLLIQNPSLLMLDEPTNHLDLPSIEWLEQYLQNYNGAVIIVSHDRQFLNQTVNKIVEVRGCKLIEYLGNYDDYLQEKALRAEIQNNAYKNQQQQIKQTERFIERFRAKASKARQVKSKEKMLHKMELIEEVEEDTTDLHFQFKFQQQPGKVIVTLKNATKRFGNTILLKDTHLEINRGDKIALIGANGKGKSTLLRMIFGKEPFEGERIWGYNVIPSFYAQHQLEALNIENEILQELKEAGSNKLEVELRQILGCFMFEGDDVFKKIKVLSGGEKARVALAKTLISEANFLLLDEPTNHLDIMSVNILTKALQQYEGTFVVVSHDRHFISQIANKIWYIENQVLKEYPGTFEEYQYWRAQQTDISVDSEKKNTAAKTPTHPRKSISKSQATEIRKIQQQISQIETEIENQENLLKILEEELSAPSVYANLDLLSQKMQAYEVAKNRLQELTHNWEQLFAEVERLSF
ncbi:MAG: ABC-F family ATP-binding cassette domain-containing protein [Cytophagales bacterium]|nr:ABC-F family ATP-binding cassette domain-containing protein [Cytophagales bacterium]MDW8385288.1 ABC-F family ATP-binding cassette domain-containing protein [Flammeovirgaceae bacterium]